MIELEIERRARVMIRCFDVYLQLSEILGSSQEILFAAHGLFARYLFQNNNYNNKDVNINN